MRVPSAFALFAVLAVASPTIAQDTGSFLVRLGNDTTSVERYTRTPARLEVEQFGRVPRVLQRRFVYDISPSGATTRAAVTILTPGAAAGAPPVQQTDATVSGDSVVVTTRRDTTVQTIRIAIPAGALIVSNASPWSLYEGQTMRLASQAGDTLRVPIYPLGAPRMSSLTVRRLGADSMVIQTDNDRYHARVDKAGRIQNVVPISGTQKYSVDRVANLDVAGLGAAFAAREKQAGAMGQLSTRDTVRTSAGGAALWIDYGRPAKRGRVIFGPVVPYGQLWRTGANAATQFRTDKALEVGGVTVPAGFYSLWTIPGADGWKLIINSETGQGGTDHKADRDLMTIPMTVSALPETVERFTISVEPNDRGGVLNMD